MNNQHPTRTPPYLSYVTFKNTIQTLASEGGLPRRIDRSVLITLSGSGQKQLIAALKFFGLIDEDGIPSDQLVTLSRANEEDWKDYLGVLLKEHYPKEIEQLGDASPKTLRDSFVTSFDGIGSSLVEPAIRFLITAAKESGIPVSAHVGKRRPRSTSAIKHTLRKEVRRSENPLEPSRTAVQQEDTLQRALLSKFPDFDPTWGQEQQQAWFSAYQRLLDMHSDTKPDQPKQEL